MRVYTGGERKTDMAPAAVEEMMVAGTPTTTMTTKVEEAGRLPSIEMEPKTLTLDQIKDAREAALYVVSTRTEEEAIRIFTAGLKPVQTTSSTSKSGSVVDSSDDDVDLDGIGGGGSNTGCGGSKGRERRRRPSFLDDVRDVATAPF